MKPETKENVQYSTAIITLFTGIVMCFLSFFFNDYVVHDSVLWYFGETMVFCGAVFGIHMVIKNRIGEAEARLNEKIDKRLNNIKGE